LPFFTSRASPGAKTSAPFHHLPLCGKRAFPFFFFFKPPPRVRVQLGPSPPLGGMPQRWPPFSEVPERLPLPRLTPCPLCAVCGLNYALLSRYVTKPLPGSFFWFSRSLRLGAAREFPLSDLWRRYSPLRSQGVLPVCRPFYSRLLRHLILLQNFPPFSWTFDRQARYVGPDLPLDPLGRRRPSCSAPSACFFLLSERRASDRRACVHLPPDS